MDEEISIQETSQKEPFKTIFISLHASSKCNMKCKYCFIQESPDVNMTIDVAKLFIVFFQVSDSYFI
jgi:sulfatase maturation enzyme AslB (radical SAM superfamily)